MTTADESTQKIAALQKRLVELDRERDSVFADIAKLERVREASGNRLVAV
jgi:cell division protein FtsB